MIGALAGISAADAICVNAIVQMAAIAVMATRFIITPQVNEQHYISIRASQKRAYAERTRFFAALAHRTQWYQDSTACRRH